MHDFLDHLKDYMYDLFDYLKDYEDWVLSLGSSPTLAVRAIVYDLLVIVTLPTIKQSPPSVKSFLMFALVNMLTWGYFWIATGWVSPSWQIHMRVLIIHLLFLSGIALVITLFAKYVLGYEDRSYPRRRHDDWGR